MKHSKRIGALIALPALAVVLLLGKTARAAAYEDDGLLVLDERTAMNLPARTLKIGILAFDYSIIDRLAVGTDPPAWAAAAFMPVLVPNLHFKLVVFDREPVTVALKVGAYWATLNSEGTSSGSFVAVPVSLFASFRLHERWWLHGEGTYNFVKAYGAGNYREADLGGNVATRTGQLGAMLEFRLRRNIALTATGRYQVYSGPLAFQGDANPDEFTNINVVGQVEPRVKHPWSGIAGAAFFWKHVRATVGVGYGYYFIPGLDVAYPKQTIFPDATLSVLL